MADTSLPNAQPSAPVEAVASAPVVPASDPKLEAIVRREKQLYRQMKEIKAREEALKARESSWKPDEYVPKKRLQDDPLAALQELGLSYEKLTEQQLNQPNANDPTIRALMSKISAMEEKLNQNATAQQQAQESNYEQVKSQMLADAQSYTQGNPDYEMLDKYGAHDLIVAEIEKEFQRTESEMGRGIIISMETAAKRVEENLFKETLKALEFNKIKNYKRPEASPVTPDSAALQNLETQVSQRPAKGQIPYKVSSVRTLTNTMTQDSPGKRNDSMEEKKRRAIAAFNGTKVD